MRPSGRAGTEKHQHAEGWPCRIFSTRYRVSHTAETVVNIAASAPVSLPSAVSRLGHHSPLSLAQGPL